jgi:vancomycin resistance protein VanW
MHKERLLRQIRELGSRQQLALTKGEPLPVLVYRHKSLIRRRLGNVDWQLQENKAVNLALATPKVCGILIRPGETFSFWRLVGSTTRAKGYKEGLTINGMKAEKGVGGGMCQFTNLLHWMTLHSPMDITEYHHHDSFDLFPDFNRQVPFGVGTSILYNYIDYRVTNNTGLTFQFITGTSDEYLHGELRATEMLPHSYHIKAEDEYFYERGGDYYRHNCVYRTVVDKCTGNTVARDLLQECNALVLYDSTQIDKSRLRGAEQLAWCQRM